MNTLINGSTIAVLPAIDQAGVPLRIAVSVGVLVFLSVGVVLLRRRRQLAAQDPNSDNDITSIRHVREEIVGFLWSSVVLALLILLDQVWSA